MRAQMCAPVFATVFAIAGCGGGASTMPHNAPPPPPATHSGPPPTTLPAHYAITDLGTNVLPSHINDSAAVVGSTGSLAFVWRNAKLTTLPVLTGYTSAVANWINNGGEIVGTSFSNGNNMDRATRFIEGGAAIDLGAPPDLPDSAAYAVNDSGLIVGGAAPLGECCVRWSAVTTFDGMGNASVWQQTFGEAYAVNEAGIFVGACCIMGFPSQNTSAFKAPPLTILPGGDSSAATGINGKGDVVDYFIGGSASGAAADSFVIYASGTTKEIDAPGIATGPGSLRALAINDNDFIVGTYDSQYFSGDHAFVYLNSIVDLNKLVPPNSGWVLESASSINLWGQIVGTGTLDGVAHGFLLTPSP